MHEMRGTVRHVLVNDGVILDKRSSDMCRSQAVNDFSQTNTLSYRESGCTVDPLSRVVAITRVGLSPVVDAKWIVVGSL